MPGSVSTYPEGQPYEPTGLMVGEVGMPEPAMVGANAAPTPSASGYYGGLAWPNAPIINEPRRHLPAARSGLRQATPSRALSVPTHRRAKYNRAPDSRLGVERLADYVTRPPSENVAGFNHFVDSITNPYGQDLSPAAILPAQCPLPVRLVWWCRACWDCRSVTFWEAWEAPRATPPRPGIPRRSGCHRVTGGNPARSTQ